VTGTGDRDGNAARVDVLVSADILRRMATELLVAAGSPQDMASLVSSSLVESNLVGHDSHGVMRLPRYVTAVQAGEVDPTARATFHPRRGGAGHVDGSWGWGQPAAVLATRMAVELARTNAVSVVTVDRCNHVGRLGEYVESVAAAGMIGMAVCNAEPVVAPFGGHERLLGTNPIAMACPRRGGAPVVYDIATAGVAEGKLSVARARGEQVALGLVVDHEGAVSTDPQAFYSGGALLPFGAHKGYGLSVFIEIIGGILSGAGASSASKYVRGNGTWVLAIDTASFMSIDEFESEVGDLSQRLTGSAAPSEPSPVLPGDPEVRTRAERLPRGIPLPTETWLELAQTAANLDVDWPRLVGSELATEGAVS